MQGMGGHDWGWPLFVRATGGSTLSGMEADVEYSAWDWQALQGLFWGCVIAGLVVGVVSLLWSSVSDAPTGLD